MYIIYKSKKLVEGLFSWNIFSNNLIYTNWLPEPLIIWFNELLLNSNNALLHIFDMIHYDVD